MEKHNLKKTGSHDLRRSCASALLEKGVSMKQIQEWLGHSDMSTTANIYSHLDAVSKADTGAAMSKALR
ncbi:MAG: tyrosine-type recombinase/integrase [Clostridia bacterium]|nr:tyrosine-type recombinase/integrase [Clostridia bacterium]